MNFEHLRTFITVAHTLHFSRAAKILHLSQPAISHHIHALEEYFKQPLFERRGREIELTPFAAKLLPRVERMVELYQEIESFSLHEDGKILTISTSNTIGEYMLADMISRFMTAEKIPADRLRTYVKTTDEALACVEEGNCDLALIEGKVSDPIFQSAVFAQDEMIPVVSPAYPLDPKASSDDLSRTNWIMREEGCTMREHTMTFVKGLGLPYEQLQILPMNNNRLLRESVIKGLGVGLLSRRSIDKELKEGKLIRILTQPPSYYRPLHIVKRTGPFTNYLARLFWDFMIAPRQSDETRGNRDIEIPVPFPGTARMKKNQS